MLGSTRAHDLSWELYHLFNKRNITFIYEKNTFYSDLKYVRIILFKIWSIIDFEFNC